MYDSNVSKSFFKKYRLLMSMKDELERLESQANQDTSVATLISFVGASNTTGTVVNNGISLSYVAAGNNATYGIFAQGTSQGTNPARLTVTGGYSGIINVKFTWSTNLSGGTTADVTISDGTNKVTATSDQIPNSTTKTSSFTVDVSTLDFTKTITITVKNNGKSSVRIKEITFEVN